MSASEGAPGIRVEGGLRSAEEQMVPERLEAAFNKSPDALAKKLENFPKYVRRQNMTKLFAQYEIFKLVREVKGSIVECGVFRGGSLFTWAHLSAVLEPMNLTRRIYGFDSFAGFPTVSDRDRGPRSQHVKPGDLYADSYEELAELIGVHDSNRPLGHVDKMHLIKGDATATIPAFIASHPHLVVSLLYLDFDLYEPTKVALEAFLPRMPRGAIIVFDELDNPLWPGETQAILDTVGMRRLRLQRVDFDPYMSYAAIE